MMQVALADVAFSICLLSSQLANVKPAITGARLMTTFLQLFHQTNVVQIIS